MAELTNKPATTGQASQGPLQQTTPKPEEKDKPLTGTFQIDRKDEKADAPKTAAAPPPKAPVFTPPPSGVRPDSGQAAEQKPSLGRVVLFHHNLDEGGVAPAIITGVCKGDEKDVVDLTVFYKNQAPYGHSDVRRGDGEGMWNWPPKV